MRNTGLGSWPERRLRISPERDAIWFEGTTTSHRGFALRVRRAAAALAGLGVGRGDRVAWISGNHPSALETLYGCGQLGAIWVPVNARLTAPEAEYVLRHSGASVVVHGRDQGLLADTLRGRLPDVRAWIAAQPPISGAADSLPYEELLAAAAAEVRDEPVPLEDPCLVMYTSGTTGRPKGAVLTHGNMTWNAVNQALGLDFAPDERTLALAPLFHIGGLNGTVNPALLRGGCAVIVRGFDPAGTLEVIEAQRVNSFFAVPTMLDAMAREPEQTAAVLRNGWYHTGDAGSVDAEGFLYVRDRYKDMIISGGENVYPAEVESALLELPMVAEAAVIGVADERWGEVGLALVVPTAGFPADPDALRAALRERLAGFKVPREVRFLAELPKTATGKIRKTELRAQYAPTEENP